MHRGVLNVEVNTRMHYARRNEPDVGCLFRAEKVSGATLHRDFL